MASPYYFFQQTWCSLGYSTIISVINWLSDLLVHISSKHCQSQTGKPRGLKFWENVSHVTCYVSCVTCHLYFFFYKKKKKKKIVFSPLKKLEKVIELVGGGSFIKGPTPLNTIKYHNILTTSRLNIIVFGFNKLPKHYHKVLP